MNKPETPHAAGILAGAAIDFIPTTALRPDPRNSRKHSEAQIEEIVASMREFGWTIPILADMDDDGLIAAGHGRLMAAAKVYADGGSFNWIDGTPIPAGHVPVIDCSSWSPDQRRKYVIADNRLAEKSEWDFEMLRVELEELDLIDADDEALRSIGFTADELDDFFPAVDPDDLTGDGDDNAPPRLTLAEKFVIPPMSILDSRSGWWMKRKRAWIGLGIRSELGRGTTPDGEDHGGRTFGQDLMRGEGKKDMGGVLYKAPSAADTGFYRKKKQVEARLGRDLTTDEFLRDHYVPHDTPSTVAATGTSIFDPVLTELLVRWFSPPGGVIFDPFAGGSVRGIVSGRLGRAYTGIDLRADQVEANEKQADDLIRETDERPIWIAGDSLEMETLVGDDFAADMVLSCPPYADLEVYSDDPRDLSTMDYADFRQTYRAIIAKTVAMMREDSFAAFVVGEARGPDGRYYGFVADTIRAFMDAGAAFYNEAILVNPLGSLPIRVAKQFETSRKLGKTHQNVLIFVKGDPKKATAAVGDVEVGDIEADDDVEPDPDQDGEPGPDPDDFTPDLSPVEEHDGVWLKRDDLWTIAGVPGGKVRTCWALSQGAVGLVTAGSRASPQVNIVAHIARRLGVPCRAHTPQGELSPEVKAAQAAGAEIVQHKAGYNNVIVARAREDAAARGWTEIPFGMECEEAVTQTRRQVANIPDDVSRIVMPVGSGMSLAGVLWGLIDAGRDVPVLGIVVGAEPKKRLDKFAPPDWRDRVTLKRAGVDYHKHVDAEIGGVRLDPHYEAKCAKFVKPGDLLWIVGIRATEL